MFLRVAAHLWCRVPLGAATQKVIFRTREFLVPQKPRISVEQAFVEWPQDNARSVSVIRLTNHWTKQAPGGSACHLKISEKDD
jgi:hypothetical protein